MWRCSGIIDKEREELPLCTTHVSGVSSPDMTEHRERTAERRNQAEERTIDYGHMGRRRVTWQQLTNIAATDESLLAGEYGGGATEWPANNPDTGVVCAAGRVMTAPGTPGP